MFLGTSRRWWFAAGLLFIAALALIVTDTGGTLGDVAGILLLFASIGVFGMSPMRYGARSRQPTAAGSGPSAESGPAAALESPGPRPAIEAGDPSDV